MVSGEGMQNILGKLEKAFGKLGEALEKEPDEFIKDSVIQRFEFTFELLWKLVKRIGESEDLECYSPRSCFKLAYKMGLIDDEDVFLSMLEYRNLTVHTYDEQKADAVYEFVRTKGYEAIGKLILAIRQRLGG